MARKPRDFKAEYARRVAKQAAKLGKSPAELTTAERKAARGHARSEGHRRPSPVEPPKPGRPGVLPEAGAVGRDYLQGRDEAPASEYKNASVPTPSDVVGAMALIQTPLVIVKLQIIGTEVPGESVLAKKIQWRSAIRPTAAMRSQLDVLIAGEPRSSVANRGVMADLASDILGGEPVAEALRWVFSEPPPPRQKKGS